MKQGKINNQTPFLSHLEALRWHLIRSSIAVFIGMIVAFFWRDADGELVVMQIIFALKDFATFPTYSFLCSLDNYWCAENMSVELINTKITTQVTGTVFIVFISGVIISFPYLLMELWFFVSPALYKTEKLYSMLVFFISLSLFLFGILFGYYLLAPVSVLFFIDWEAHGDINNLIEFMSYVNTVGKFILGTGIMFQFPVVIYFLTKFGLVTPQQLRQYRRHAFVVILIMASVFTPPDIFSQILIGLPIYLLYEISILVASITSRKK